MFLPPADPAGYSLYTRRTGQLERRIFVQTIRGVPANRVGVFYLFLKRLTCSCSVDSLPVILSFPCSFWFSLRIYECNKRCKCCAQMCTNRLVQHGLQVRLQLFKTQNKGWGIRCLDDIAKGSFVCIYAGEEHALKERRWKSDSCRRLY